MRLYIDECEHTINEQRERMREVEKQVGAKTDQQKQTEIVADKLR